MKYFSTLFILLFFNKIVIAQAPFINQVWDTSSGAPTDSKDRTKASLDPNGNFVFIGTKGNGNNSDIFLNCIHPDGTVAWEQVCPSSSTYDDWGTDLAIDDSGNLFVCGVRHNGQNQDYFVAKYSASGNLYWQYNYDNGNNDVAEAIDIDSYGDVYVIGTSEGTNSMNDFATIKLNGQSGAEVWIKRYDFNNLEEKAVDLLVDQSNNVMVCGTSYQNPVDSRFTLIKYDPINGSLLDIKRHNSPSAGYDLPYEMARDNYNNYYIVGTSNKYSTDSDIKLIKYNSALNVNWVEYIDYNGLNDEGFGLDIISSTFVAITGYSENNFGGTEFVTSLYTLDGNYLWNHNRLGDQELSQAEGHDIVADSNGHVYVTGFVKEDGLKKYRTAAYHLNGQLYWEKLFKVDGRNSRSKQIVEKDGSVTVVGDSKSNNDREFISVRYDIKERDQTPHLDPNTGEPDYAARQLIVKVNPAVVKTTEIDAVKSEFWTLEEIFVPFAVDSIRSVLGGVCGTPKCDITVYKIFKSLKTTLVTSQSRLNQTVKVPRFWSTFVFEFPEGTDIILAHEELKTLFSKVIIYSHINPVCTPDAVADDSYYSTSQASLNEISPFAPSSHINVEPAWDIETGKSHVKCGVFDTGARFTHEDFGDGTQFGNIITDGWDYFNGTGFYGSTDPYPNYHGTQVTGIIGAIRNNDLGVAGVAGGNDDIGEAGLDFYELIILNPGPVTNYYDYIGEAIFDSSIDDPVLNAGFGINLANHSWSFDGNDGQQFTYANVQLMIENTHFANRMGVTQVCSRGNTNTPLEFDVRYPAMADDKWILNVTQTGTDGEWKDGQSVSQGNEDNCLSFIEGDIDIGAPGVNDMIWTPAIDSDNSYDDFSCSSAAAPHVTGVVGLLMSHHNNPTPDYQNLAPEDCEEIIQQTAVDTDLPGYDDLTGYGRIDAGQALNLVNAPDCYLEHFGTTSSASTKSSAQIASNITVYMNDQFENSNGVFFGGGSYKANVYKITASIQYTPILATHTESAIWPRHSSSTLFPLYDNSSNHYFDPREEITIDSYGNNVATMHGYVYELFDFSTGSFVGWAPHDNNLANAELEFTLVRCNQNFFTGVSIDENKAENSISLYPNPGIDRQTLKINLIETADVNILLYDQTGKVVQEVFTQNNCEGEIIVITDLSELANGFYTYQITIGDKIEHIKAIKQ